MCWFLNSAKSRHKGLSPNHTIGLIPLSSKAIILPKAGTSYHSHHIYHSTLCEGERLLEFRIPSSISLKLKSTHLGDRSLSLKLKALVWARLQTGCIAGFCEFSLKRDLLAWARLPSLKTRAGTWESFYYSHLGETCSLRQKHNKIFLHPLQHHSSTKNIKQTKNEQNILKSWNPSFPYLKKENCRGREP